MSTTERPSSTATDEAVDASILRRVGVGDQAALAELYDRFAPRVFSLARHLCGDGAAAETVTADVFRTAWRTAGRFDPARGSAATWLLGLAHRGAVDAVRAGRRGPDRPGGTDPDVVAGAVRDALAALPPTHRDALLPAYYDGHTLLEVAAILGLPIGTVRTRTHEAVRRLRPLR